MISRGFVTIATGREEYFILAANLLASYKRFNPNPLPFAIICDRKNKHTELFDDVVILDKPSCSFLDKLRLVDLSPYDETIFIDADSLVYDCLDGLWDIVKDAPDFGIFGGLINPEDPQWRNEASRFRRMPWPVHFYCVSQGGMHFIRKSPALKEFLQLCDSIVSRHMDIFEFEGLPGSDGVFPLACSAFGYPPVENWYNIFCFYPESDIKRLDIRRGVVQYVWRPKAMSFGPKCYFVHFGIKGTREWLYRREAYRLNRLSEGKKPSPVRLAGIRCSTLLFSSLRWLYKRWTEIKSLKSRS